MKRFVLPLFSALLAAALIPSVSAAPAKSTTAATAKKKAPTSATPSQAEPKRTVPEAYPAEDDGAVPMVSAGSAIVVDAATGKVLHEVNADQRRPVASTQKLLTALIVAESGNLEKEVRVEASDTWAEPTKLYIKPGDTYTRYQFLNVLLVKSMNDVARALARDNAGSIEAFADRMNAKAAELGMRNSNFVNPNGLPVAGQYSTARDMARLALFAYRNRTIRSFVCQKTMTWKYNSGKVTTFQNTNAVLRNFGPCNGMKTGTTDAAGRCLVSSASYGGRDIIVVVLGDNRNVWSDSHRLLAWGLKS